MMNYKANTIVLIPFPFSDLSGAKQRPALVIVDQKDKDITCLPITSKFGTNMIDMPIEDESCLGFHFPIKSYVRPHKIYTIESRLVRKKIGSLDEEYFEKVKKVTIQFLQNEQEKICNE